MKLYQQIFSMPIMISELEFTKNQRFQFERFEAAHSIL